MCEAGVFGGSVGFDLLAILPRSITPLCPAGHLPLKGGDRLLSMSSPTTSVAGRAAEKAAGAISPLEGEMSGRTEGGTKRRLLLIRSCS